MDQPLILEMALDMVTPSMVVYVVDDGSKLRLPRWYFDETPPGSIRLTVEALEQGGAA